MVNYGDLGVGVVTSFVAASLAGCAARGEVLASRQGASELSSRPEWTLVLGSADSYPTGRSNDSKD